MTIQDRALHFRQLHERAPRATNGAGILVLPNAWDAMTARLAEEAGARAVATTSSGVSWSLGRPDGEGLTRREMLGALRRIVSAVQVPVSADVERGYGTGTLADAAATVRGVLDAGAVGINLEDSPGVGAGEVLRRAEDQAAQIAAARAAAAAYGVDLFINARVDVYLRQVGAEAGRFDETVARARVYTTAGADGIFVPGVLDAPTIGRLAAAIAAPLNVLAGPGAPSTAELRALGVARVSVGPALARSAMAHFRRAARELVEQGTYDALRDGVPFPEANALFVRRA